ncbi:hypothetical protein ENBRE01_1586 [Enteropsectra breve]|nr:hypothetical protein ENBRE01_1586 [Enteropsectra breve]
MQLGILLIIKLIYAFNVMRQTEMYTEHLKASKNNICRICNDTLLYDELNSMLFKNDDDPRLSASPEHFYLYLKCVRETCNAFYHATCFIKNCPGIMQNGFIEDPRTYEELNFCCKVCQFNTKLKPMEILGAFRQNFFMNAAFMYWLFDQSATIKIEFIECLNLLRLPVGDCKKLLETKKETIGGEYFNICLRLYTSCMDSDVKLNTCIQDLMAFVKYNKMYSWGLRMAFLNAITNKLDSTVASQPLSTLINSMNPANFVQLQYVFEIYYEIYFAQKPSKKEILEYFSAAIFKKECIGLQFVNYSRVHGCKLPSGAEITREFFKEFSERCAKGDVASMAYNMPNSIIFVLNYLESVDGTAHLFTSFWLKQCAKSKITAHFEKHYLRQILSSYQLHLHAIINYSEKNKMEIQDSLKLLLTEGIISNCFWTILWKNQMENFLNFFNTCHSLYSLYNNCPLVDIWINMLIQDKKTQMLENIVVAADRRQNAELMTYIFANYKHDPKLFFSNNNISRTGIDFLFNELKMTVWKNHILTNSNCHFYLDKTALLPNYEYDDTVINYLKELPGWFPHVLFSKFTTMFNRALVDGQIWNTGYMILAIPNYAIPTGQTQADIEKWCAATKIECMVSKLYFESTNFSKKFFTIYFGYILSYLDKKLCYEEQLELKMSSVYHLTKIAMGHVDGELLKEMFAAILDTSCPHYFAGILLLCLEDYPALKFKLLDWFAYSAACRKRSQRPAKHETLAFILQKYRERMVLAKFNCSSKTLFCNVTSNNIITICNELACSEEMSPFKYLISQGIEFLSDIKTTNFTMYKCILDETVVLPQNVFDGLKKRDID